MEWLIVLLALLCIASAVSLAFKLGRGVKDGEIINRELLTERYVTIKRLQAENDQLKKENAALNRDNRELLGKAQKRGPNGKFVSKKSTPASKEAVDAMKRSAERVALKAARGEKPY